MIEIENVKNEFEKYIKQFNPEEGRIKLKIEHIERVAEMSKILAEKLNLNEEQIKLAETIGYCHDIGRFKQAEIYNTFSDKNSINHAELSAKVLFEDGLIEKFKVEQKYYEIIKKAILNHNKYKIDDNLTDEELFFAKLIRDADKLDIYYTICKYDFESIFWYKDFECKEISSKIMNQFIYDHVINYKDVENNADQIATFYAYIYDLNFDFSLEYLKNRKYLEQFAQRVKEHFSSEIIKKQVDEILKISNEYMEKI